MFGHNFYELIDHNTLDPLAIVVVTTKTDPKKIDEKKELEESWEEFNFTQKHIYDPCDIETFIDWHNQRRVYQIQRIETRKIVS